MSNIKKLKLMIIVLLGGSSSMLVAQTDSIKLDSIIHQEVSMVRDSIAPPIVEKSNKIQLRDRVTEIQEVTVKGHSLKSKNSSSKIDVIINDDIKNLVVEQPLRLLEQVSGINVVGYGQGGVADQFSIRGYSGGGHSGEAGVEVDGISLNEAEGHGDGYSDFNVLIPINIKKVSVYKGPSSALFGRFAQGGTISLDMREGGNYNDIKLTGGSYKTFDAQYAMGKTLKIGDREDALKTNFAIQLFNTDGYVKNSGILKGNISGKLTYQMSPKSVIALSILGHRSEWDAPGYIPKDQFLDKKRRRMPHHTAENDGGNKFFLAEKLDFRYNITDNIKWIVYGYSIQQNFTRYAKYDNNPTFGQTDQSYKRNVYAFGSSLNGNSKWGMKDFDWTAGVEFYAEKTDREEWNTSYRRRIDPILKGIYKIHSLSVYSQGELVLHRLFRPTIGFRFDTFGGDYQDKMMPNLPKLKIQNLSHFSPKIGFRSTLLDNFDFRINVSNGFTLPRGDYKYKTDSKLKPLQLWQYEAGLLYQNDNFHFDVTGFILDTSQEILERPPGSGKFINAGKTRRKGVEVDSKFRLKEYLTLNGSFTYTRGQIKEGENKGRYLTQLPETILNLGATYTSPIGLGADVMFRSVAHYYTTLDNDIKDGGYNIVNLKIFYNFDKLFSSKGNIFVSVNNLFDKLYSESVFGDWNPYSASPTRNVTFGVNYSF